MSDGNVNRRGFLARILAAGTAPVLVGFIDDETTGLVVPDREIVKAREGDMPRDPPSPLIFGASRFSIHNIWSGITFGEFNHVRAHNGDGSLVFLWNGELWAVPAFQVPVGHPLGKPEYRTTG